MEKRNVRNTHTAALKQWDAKELREDRKLMCRLICKLFSLLSFRL